MLGDLFDPPHALVRDLMHDDPDGSTLRLLNVIDCVGDTSVFLASHLYVILTLSDI